MTYGVRLGTSAGTTRGFGEAEFRQIGAMVLRVLGGLAATDGAGDSAVEAEVLADVRALCARFPVYP